VKIEVDVASVLVPQIETVMAAPDGKKPYFASAMFYYENGLDLKKAAAWMDAAIAEQPDAFYMIYRKGLILEKAGDKAGALAAAEKSLEMARKAPGLVGTEYSRLNEALIARLK
jgi:tetratricopeptide (TPR) repeat protein